MATFEELVRATFDADFYLTNNPGVADGADGALQHFFETGLSTGLDPNSLFDSDRYLSDNPDVAAAGANAYEHFLNFGLAEGRGLPNYNEQLYLTSNPDVAAAVDAGALVNGLQHAVLFGLSEFRAGVSAPVAVEKFKYGVASGDPETDSVVLWTHAQPTNTSEIVDARWQVSSDASFQNIVTSGVSQTSQSRDFTMKVVAEGLTPGTDYFYRFLYDGESSAVGQTKTLPEGSVDSLTFAIFSCTNYPAGYFNAYNAAVDRGFDYAIHLGDYIYEYGIGEYATENAEALGRIPSPTSEIVSAADYSARYQQYHSDSDLQALRANAPMIMMWDDHETANDSYRNGAQNHDTATEGNWSDRRDNALDAFYNWNPIRVPESGDLTDKDQSITFGDLATLHMLETRLQARDETRADIGAAITEKAGEYAADTTGATFAADVLRYPSLVPDGTDLTDATAIAALATDATFVANLAVQALLTEATDADRSMIGDAQMAEVTGRINGADTTWDIIGSQTLMNEMTLPSALLLDPTTITDFLTAAGKLAQGLPLTETEVALLNSPQIPYNLDSWDGYQAERTEILNTLAANDANAIIIAGDTHNAWSGEIRAEDNSLTALHFGTPGVTSPGLEAVFPTLAPSDVASTFVSFNDSLSYANTENRGYLSLTLTPTQVTSEFVLLDTIQSTTYEATLVTQTAGIDLF